MFDGILRDSPCKREATSWDIELRPHFSTIGRFRSLLPRERSGISRKREKRERDWARTWCFLHLGRACSENARPCSNRCPSYRHTDFSDRLGAAIRSSTGGLVCG